VFDLGTPAGSHDKLDITTGKSLTFSGASVLTITSSGGAEPGEYILVTAAGGISGDAPATLNLPDDWVATVDIVGDDLVLDVTSTGAPADPFAIWSGGADFNADANGDGVDNGMAWLLGAVDKDANALGLLPQVSVNSGDLILTFTCLKVAGRGDAVLKVQYSKDLGIGDPWHDAAVPDDDGTVNSVIFDTTADGDYIDVIATIPVSLAAPGTKLFGRLIAVKP